MRRLSYNPQRPITAPEAALTIDHIYALPPGTRLEEYRLDEVLGAGGFGITYRAYDAHLDKFVAIKEYLPGEFAVRTEASMVSPKSRADAEDYHWGLSRFLDEARTLARFDHPHLNKVHRFFERNGTAYMVLEYVDGETLASRLSRVTYLEEAALRRLLEEVLSGLSVVHEAGYVHRDLKPGNLMLREEDGGAVVLDFGAARQAVGQRSRPITSILTPGYAPIEQYDSKADDVGPWSDMYALGMVCYRCISGMRDGELPDAVTRSRLQRKGVVDLVPAVEAGQGRYSPGLLEAIDWAMEVEEGSRPASVAAWRRMLDAPEAGEVRSAEGVDEPGPVRRAAPGREGQGESDEARAAVGGGRRWGLRALVLVGLVVYVMSVFEWMSVYGPAEDTAGAEVAVAPGSETETVQAELQGPAGMPAGQPAVAPADTVEAVQVTGLPPGIGVEDTCDGKPEGSACWMELENQPGCYLWNSHLDVNEAVTWSAGCVEGLAEGTGEVMWVRGDDREHVTTSTGQIQQGKYHGQWVVRQADGQVEEGPYVDGKRHGRWVARQTDGDVGEGPFVDGKEKGHWVLRFADGGVQEGPYVDGKKHGQWGQTLCRWPSGGGSLCGR